MPKKNLKDKLLKNENLYLGLGVAMFTKDRLEDLIDFMVKEAKIAKNAAQARKQLMTDGKAQYAAFLSALENGMNEAMTQTMSTAKNPSRKIKATLKKKKK